MQDGDLYRLFFDPMALVPTNEKLGVPSSFEEEHTEHVWWEVVEIGSETTVESVIDSKLELMGVLKSTKAVLLDSLRKRELTLMRLLPWLPKDSLRVNFLRVLL
jgi:hypothetical protein